MKFTQAMMAVAAATAMQVAVSEPAHATGKMKCEAGPESGWTSRERLEAKLKAEGWQVRKSKVDGGCYEVYGTTPEGDRVEAYFHPVTLEKLLVTKRGGKVLFRKAD
ncbi:MAG: PepSY domain-containing protein [Pseudomonadota bacterium]